MERPSPARLALAVWLVACTRLAVQAVGLPNYGWFGDELYYLACADHLAWGYVDHPPLSIALLAGWRALFGDGLVAVRAASALAGAGAVVLTGVVARDLGGGARAQTLAAICMAVAPVNLVLGNFYSMNAFDVVFWLAVFALLPRTLTAPTPRHWLLLGFVLGLGLLNKVSVGWLGAGLFVGLLLSPERAQLATPWPWAAGLVCALVFAPHVLWQVQNGWPTAEFVRIATTKKMVPVGPVDLFAAQVVAMHPVAAPLWIGGLALLFRMRDPPQARIFAVVFVVTAAILIANGTSRPNYLALAQPPLLAAGAIGLERVSQRRRLRWLWPTFTALLVTTGLLAVPATSPVLPIDSAVAYMQGFPVRAPKMERREIGALPPHFADMIGWPEIVAAVARARDTLPESERERAVVLAFNYSDAGAIDRLGTAHGLPRAISTHNSYWTWGPRGATGDVAIVIGGERDNLARLWRALEPAGVIECGHCLPVRNGRTIWIAREPARPLVEVWSELRHFD